MPHYFPLFAVASGCAVATRAIARRLPADIRVRSVATMVLAVVLVVAQGVDPAGLAGVPTLGPSIGLLAVALCAGLTWRIPDRLQSWGSEIAEIVMILVVLVTTSIAALGPSVAAGVCLVWALVGAIMGHRIPHSESHPAVGVVLVLGVLAATLLIHMVTPVHGVVAAALAVFVAIALERPPRLPEVGCRVLMAGLGASAIVVSLWVIDVPLDDRLWLPALVGVLLVEMMRRPEGRKIGGEIERPDAPELLDAEHATLAVLGRLADPMDASASHLMLSLEHVCPGGRIELLRNPSSLDTQGPVIEPVLLAEVCRRGVLHSDTNDALTRSVALALRKLGPNVTLLPVTYEAQVHGALLIRGMQRREGTLAETRRFADLLGHRLEAQRLFTELQHKQRLATLGTFAAALFHDLRSPLATVRLDIQMLQRARPDADQGALSDAIQALDRVLDELSGTLDYTRPLELDMGTVDLVGLANDIVRSQRPRADKQEVHLEGPSPALTRVLVRGDRARLLRALENLLRNALEVSRAGSTVKVVVTPVASGVELAVEDQGPGIDPALEERIFEPFVTTKREGIGLGLAIVRKIIETHKGRVSLRSQPGLGTTMTVWLPVARS